MTQSEREPEPTGGAPNEPVARPPAPPGRQRTAPGSRVEGLAPAAIRCLQQASQAIEKRDLDGAETALRGAAAMAPDHAEILRLTGVVAYLRGHFPEAITVLKRALEAWPDDALVLGNLGTAYADSGRTENALLSLRRACEVAPEQPAAWFNLGKLFDAQAHVAEGAKAFAKALALAPRHLSARIAHANALATLGHTDEAAAEYRAAIAQEPRSAQAWLGLANLKTVRLDADESAALERLHAEPALSDSDRAVAGFALGKVREDEGRHAEAFTVLSTANAARRRTSPWDATLFSRQVDAIQAAFAPETLARASNPALGDSVIFIVSLPRSGSTLVEQILAAHPDVEGASELPDLETVILEESALRKQRFPEWVANASAADWQRLGQRYLHRTRRWREQKPRFTDKMPDNWLLAGAALAMLPGARVVNVRRDPVETCWSCFKQVFGAGRHAYSYDLADLAETWRDYDRLCRFWSARFPDRMREQSYERLVSDPEGETRALLDFCGLAFDPACLRSHEAERSVRTASAAQVREPLRTNTARTAAYGSRLDPLRRMLAAETRDANETPLAQDGVTLAQRSERVLGLDDQSARDLLRAAALLGSGRIEESEPIIERVRVVYPDHDETLRLSGALDSARGRHVEALDALRRAAASKPDDALIFNTLGAAQAAAGDDIAALASFTRAAALDPHAANVQHNLGNLLSTRGDTESARDAFARAVAIDPGFVPARLALADTLRALGQSDEAARQWRETIAHDPQSSVAWQGLAETRPSELTAAERSALENEYQRARRSDTERASLAYALANVLEARAQYREAFAMFVGANALRRRAFDWDSERYSRRCERILEAFPAAAETSTGAKLGEECIFVLGMPDGASATIARALRSHPDVSRGTSPARVFAAESATRGQRFAQWAPQAGAAEWQRMARAYLAGNASNDARRFRFVDAESFGVEHAGAVAMMLPAARFIVIDGDALESCFACFRRDFHDAHRYSCDFAELAAFWHDQQRLLQRWNERFADRIVRVDASALAADAAAETSRLFAALGLDATRASFDAPDLRERADARSYGDLVKPLAGMLDHGDANADATP